MKDPLAEKLLVHVLNWSPADIARERPILQAMANFKYDGYEQYSPGMRFIESLAIWLNQFEPKLRPTAYDFVKSRLVFFSSQEVNHLVEVSYPDYIRSQIIQEVAIEKGINPWHVGVVANLTEFRIRRRQTLFLGLSDGARIDTFRRANRDLNHEQIWQTYELSDERVKTLKEKLEEHLKDIDPTCGEDRVYFKTIVLLDDFSASGTSYCMEKSDGSKKGKIANFLKLLIDSSSKVSTLVESKKFNVVVVLYMATEQSIEHLNKYFSDFKKENGIECSIRVVQKIPSGLKMSPSDGTAYNEIINSDDYYDPKIWDDHVKKGGGDNAKYGYAQCGLPLTLHHNTPNNAVAILWSYDTCEFRGLFPRVQRHKEME